MNEAIGTAQDYLTVEREGVRKKMIDLATLVERHALEKILGFLRDYLREKEKKLRELILIDRTQGKVDEAVSAMFRLHMAIRTLEGELSGKEVKGIVQPQQGTEEGGRIPERHSSSHSRPRQREDTDSHGENRDTGQGTQRAA